MGLIGGVDPPNGTTFQTDSHHFYIIKLLYYIMQLSSFIVNENDYALSKDLDVAFWMDYKHFKGEPPLEYATQDFVIINSQLHSEFDEFKAKEVTPPFSFLPLNELLEYYCWSECKDKMKSSEIRRYGKVYVYLSSEEIDSLVEWVHQLRAQFTSGGESTFLVPIIEKLAEKYYGKTNYYLVTHCWFVLQCRPIQTC